MEERAIDYYDYDESNFKSGDLIVTLRMSGNDGLILSGVGGTLGHAAIVL